MIQDLSTKRIIGRGRKSEGLYILETKVPKSVACSGVITLLNLHCRMGHPSLPLLKKLYPQFSSLSSLNYESCQYAKLHRVHLRTEMLRCFLGIEVMRSKHGIFLSQGKYVFDLLSETRKLGVKPCNFPMAPSVHLTREGETFEDPKRYRRLIGKLNYF